MHPPLWSSAPGQGTCLCPPAGGPLGLLHPRIPAPEKRRGRTQGCLRGPWERLLAQVCAPYLGTRGGADATLQLFPQASPPTPHPTSASGSPGSPVRGTRLTTGCRGVIRIG